MLEVQGLVKYYGARCVVNGVDFRVDQGEIVGLLGPNGAGKTTSFRMTCGMIEPNQGKVVLNDLDVTRWPMYRRAREGGMGYLAQESSVFRKLTVEKNLLGVMELLGMDRKTRYARCDNCSTSSTSSRCAKRSPSRSPAANGGAWRSPGPWSPIPRSSCWTNPLRASIP